MLIVPVIDLCRGVVVHAIEGNRKEYRAINSNICSTSAPLDVVTGFLELFNFKSIYIADLDALEQQNDHVKIIESICNKYPNLEIWLDTGSTLVEYYLQNASFPNLRLILSSESMSSVSNFTLLLNNHSQHNFILSLDYKANRLLGPQKLLSEKKLWPKDVIVLNLNNVGAKRGYKFPTALDQHELVNGFNTYYGGGIRDSNDIKKLKSLRFAGALVSTALHSQLITGDEIHSLSQ